jgi:hypothetical protein
VRIQHSFSRSDTGLNALLLSRLAQASGQSQQDAASYCSPTACPPNSAAARQSPQKVMERVCAVDLYLYVNAYVLFGATQHILEPAGRSGMLPCHPAGLQQQHSNSSTTTTMKPSLYQQVVEQPLHKYASLYCCCPPACQEHGAAGAGTSLSDQRGNPLLQPQHPQCDCERRSCSGMDQLQQSKPPGSSSRHKHTAAIAHCAVTSTGQHFCMQNCSGPAGLRPC